MYTDKYGQIILNEQDLCELYLQNPDRKISSFVEKPITFDQDLSLSNIPTLLQYIEQNVTIEEFDNTLQKKWLLPAEYQDFDIVKWVLDQCKTDPELQRVGQELLLYQERDLFPLLTYLKYLVDTMRKNNVVWGVGRGSSVSSYVLYLIGIHKIDSMFYDLDIGEFLR